MEQNLYNITKELDRLNGMLSEFKQISYNNGFINNQQLHDYILQLIDISTAIEAHTEGLSLNTIKLKGIINN